MNYRAFIVDAETGEGRWSSPFEFHASTKWAWTRGEYNFGCDCNRGALWASAGALTLTR